MQNIAVNDFGANTLPVLTVGLSFVSQTRVRLNFDSAMFVFAARAQSGSNPKTRRSGAASYRQWRIPASTWLANYRLGSPRRHL